MVNIFLRLLLGHLVGDFVLQPLWLALSKRKGWQGLSLHVAIVSFVTVIMIWGAAPYWWAWGIVLFLVHLFIDQFRTFVLVDNSRGKGVVFFVLDQFVHVFSLVILSWLIVGLPPHPLEMMRNASLSQPDIVLLLLCLFVAIVWAAPILEIELVVAVMSYRQSAAGEGQTTEIEPIRLPDRMMGAAERLTGAALMMTNLGAIVMPLAFLPRFVWLRRQTTSNRWLVALKTGVSFLTTLLMGLLLRGCLGIG